MRDRLTLARQLWRYLGPAWLLFRLKYVLQMRTGWLRRRMPVFVWETHPLGIWLKPDIPSEPEEYHVWRREHGGRFFFETLPDLPREPQRIVEDTDAILAGCWRYFGHTVYDAGCPPDWHLNPMTSQRWPHDRHWTHVSDGGEDDIKLVWEASRFGVVYTLVRAYAITRDERYPRVFWQLIDDWAANNPPNTGANWGCGQEATFRAMAWCFGLYGFARAANTTPAQIVGLAAMIAAHGERIERNIAYARSQKNNHAISEGVGLWTIGLLFPEFKRAQRWRQLGRRVIQAEVERQVYDDGAYVQHSMNYHRLMLHDLIWALRLGEVNNDRLPESVYSKFKQAVEFLTEFLDRESGQVPNYGANDGSLILPLNTCDYLDYRPVLQAGYFLLNKNRLFEPGPWDEDLLWLFGPEALDSAVEATHPIQDSFAGPTGGYITLRGQQSWAMVRCAQYRDRPSDADQLHVDLWWRGINIACDAGTYLYTAAPPWNNGLSSTRVHNTVTVDGQDQMRRASRFLWLDWAQGTTQHHAQSDAGHMAYWQGCHEGYARLALPVMHRRGVVRLGAERWVIIDALESSGDHAYALHWLLPDLPHNRDETQGALTLDTPHGPYQIRMFTPDAAGQLSVVRADSNSVRGWRSRYYAHKEPAISLALTLRGSSTHFLTLFGPPDTTVTSSERAIIVAWSDQEASITLGDGSALVHTITMDGALVDTMEV